MRKRITLLLFSVAVLAATAAVSQSAARPSATSAALASCTPGALNLVTDGQLTIGTDNPAYPPWFAGGSKSSWKINDPATGKGYESAVAYAVARKLGFAKSAVKWTYVPFNKAFAPGPKSFDFDINQISITPARAKVVSFSVSYYDVNQAIVVKKGTKIARHPLDQGPEAVQARRPARHDELCVHRVDDQAVAEARRCSRRTPARCWR